MEQGDLREAVQVAILAEDPIAGLRKVDASGIWKPFYATFEEALRALKVPDALIEALRTRS